MREDHGQHGEEALPTEESESRPHSVVEHQESSLPHRLSEVVRRVAPGQPDLLLYESCRRARRSLSSVLGALHPDFFDTLHTQDKDSLIKSVRSELERLFLTSAAVEEVGPPVSQIRGEGAKVLNVKDLLNELYSRFLPRAREQGSRFTIALEGSLPGGLVLQADRFRRTIELMVDYGLLVAPHGDLALSFRFDNENDSLSLTLATFLDHRKKVVTEKEKLLFNPCSVGQSYNSARGDIHLLLLETLARELGGLFIVEDQGNNYTLHFSLTATPQRMLPSVKVEETSPPHVKSQENLWFRQLEGKVLLLTSDELTFKVLAGYLGESQLTVERVCTGGEALAEIAQTSYDLIFMDLDLPEEDGFQTATIFEDYGVTAPLIALIPGSHFGELLRAAESEFDGFIPLPFSAAHLHRLCRVYLAPETIAPGETLLEHDSCTLSHYRADHEYLIPSTIGSKNPTFDGLVDEFLLDLRGFLEALALTISEKNFTETRKIAHDLKGTSAMLGYPALAEQARVLTRAAEAESNWALVKSYKRIMSLSHSMFRTRFLEKQAHEYRH